MAIHEQLRERLALVAYGSETGNAQDYADELDRLAQRLRFSTQLSPLNAVEPVRATATSSVGAALSPVVDVIRVFRDHHCAVYNRSR